MEDVKETQIKPVAGIRVCPNCGRRSEVPRIQPFTCVCGTPMEPGEEHTSPGESPPKGVDD